MMQATIFGKPKNFAVVQLPERKHAGVVVQGDTLHGIIEDLKRARMSLENNDIEEVEDSLNIVLEQLGEALQYYQAVCTSTGIALPYFEEKGP